METSVKEKIGKITLGVDSASHSGAQEMELLEENLVNGALDAINECKAGIEDLIVVTKGYDVEYEKLTWMSREGLDSDGVKTVLQFIAAGKRYAEVVMKRYEGSVSLLGRLNISLSEVKELGHVFEDLRETLEDVEMVFSELIDDPEFNDVTDQLSNL